MREPGKDKDAVILCPHLASGAQSRLQTARPGAISKGTSGAGFRQKRTQGRISHTLLHPVHPWILRGFFTGPASGPGPPCSPGPRRVSAQRLMICISPSSPARGISSLSLSEPEVPAEPSELSPSLPLPPAIPPSCALSPAMPSVPERAEPAES